MLEPQGDVDDTGQVAKFRSTLPAALQGGDQRCGQNERSADEIRHAQVLNKDKMSGAHFDAIGSNVVDDASVGADGQEDEQGEQNGLERTV